MAIAHRLPTESSFDQSPLKDADSPLPAPGPAGIDDFSDSHPDGVATVV